MDVDQTRADDMTLCVDAVMSVCGGEIANGGYAFLLDGEIATKGGLTTAIEQLGVADE